MADTAFVTGAIGGVAGVGIGDEADFSVFENKSGLAEDLKFLASMPELCDVRFHRSKKTKLELPVKFYCPAGDFPRWRHPRAGVRGQGRSGGAQQVNRLLINRIHWWWLVAECSRRCSTPRRARSARRSRQQVPTSCACSSSAAASRCSTCKTPPKR